MSATGLPVDLFLNLDDLLNATGSPSGSGLTLQAVGCVCSAFLPQSLKALEIF